MKYLSISILILVLSALQQKSNGTLAINSGNFNNDKGKAVLFLFRKEDKVPSAPYKTFSAEIINRKAVFQIPNIPNSDYAIILLHDENDNGKIDHSMGFPSEQLGYSNNWELGIFTGMPTFSKLKFQYSVNQSVQNINISYKKNKE